jgi:hypothetical protein
MSTAKQTNSPERQREVYLAYCDRWNLCSVGEYEDLAVSATHTRLEDRPGLMRMWGDAGTEQLREAARDIERRWATWSPVSKRELLQSMITHITPNPDDLAASVITWRNEQE